MLSAGAHPAVDDGGCVMELVSFLAGEQWSDHPACTHPRIARAAQIINDRLDDEHRDLLVPLIPRLTGTARIDETVDAGLARWCADRTRGRVRSTSQAWWSRSTDAERGWYDDSFVERECQAAADLAAARVRADAYDDLFLFAAAHAAAYAAALVSFLTELLDEFDRLTGRGSAEFDPDAVGLVAVEEPAAAVAAAT